MKRFMWWVCLLVFGIGLNEHARAQVAVGPFTAVHFLTGPAARDLPILGLSGFMPLSRGFVLSAEYQTYGNSDSYGVIELASMSTPERIFQAWSYNRRTHQAIGGIHYQPRTRVAQPRLLLGLNFGYEWYNGETQISEISADQDLLVGTYKSNSERLLLFPSLTFVNDWRALEFLVQFRYGVRYVHHGGLQLTSPSDFAQLLAGAHVKLH